MRLNDSYEQARGQILMMVPLPSINKTYSLLIEGESQRIISQTSSSSSSSELSAMFTTGNSSIPATKPRSYTSSSYDPNAFCDYCKRTGHTRGVCYKLHGYPPGYERKKKGSNNSYRRGRNPNERRPYPNAHNVIGDVDLDHGSSMNQRSHDFGRCSRQTDHTDYHRGMTVLHQQYNQILNMLG